MLDIDPTRAKELAVLGQGGNMVSKRALSHEEFIAFKAHCSRLTLFSNEQSLFKMATLNHTDYGRARDGYREAFVSEKLRGMQMLSDVAFDLNRRVVNFLAAMRMYLDHTESNLKTQDRAAKLARFKKVTADQYDGIFAYRFLYKLRNYAQHCGIPAEGFDARKRLPNSDARKEDAIVEFGLRCDRDALLKYNSWGALLRAEIQAKPEEFDIDEILGEGLKSLSSVQHEMFLEDLPELSSAVQALDLLLDELEPVLVGVGSGTPAVIEPRLVSAGPPKKINLTVHWFPLEIMDKISGATSGQDSSGDGRNQSN